MYNLFDVFLLGAVVTGATTAAVIAWKVFRGEFD
jgi:hypothetical protein